MPCRYKEQNSTQAYVRYHVWLPSHNPRRGVVESPLRPPFFPTGSKHQQYILARKFVPGIVYSLLVPCRTAFVLLSSRVNLNLSRLFSLHQSRSISVIYTPRLLGIFNLCPKRASPTRLDPAMQVEEWSLPSGSQCFLTPLHHIYAEFYGLL